MVQLMHMEMVVVMLYDGDDGFGAMRFVMSLTEMTLDDDPC